MAYFLPGLKLSTSPLAPPTCLFAHYRLLRLLLQLRIISYIFNVYAARCCPAAISTAISTISVTSAISLSALSSARRTRPSHAISPPETLYVICHIPVAIPAADPSSRAPLFRCHRAVDRRRACRACCCRSRWCQKEWRSTAAPLPAPNAAPNVSEGEGHVSARTRTGPVSGSGGE